MRFRLLLLTVLLFPACATDDSAPTASGGSATTALTTTSLTTTVLSTVVLPTTVPSTTVLPTTVLPTTVLPTTVAPGGIARTIDSSVTTPDGLARTYRIYVPASLPGGPVPLVLAFHGGTGSGKQFQFTSGLDVLAEQNGFLVVYPDGTGAAADGTGARTWNAGYCCGAAERNEIDDVGFVRLLIDTIESQYDIDPGRVFALGHSNGGMLSYRLACELSDRIVAVALQAGSLGIDSCTPTAPVALLHIHGTADANHPIEGGVGEKSIAGVDFRSADFSVRTTAAAMGCVSEPSRSTDAGNPDLAVSTWAPCDRGVMVQLIAVRGATHAWMGHPTPNPGADPPYQDLDASAVAVSFLLTYSRWG